MKTLSSVLAGLLCAVGLGLSPLSAVSAQNKTLTVVIPFPPGGAVDGLARVLSQEMAKLDGYDAVIVDNRPGAGGQVAMNQIRSATPNGDTIFMGHAGAFVLNRYAYDKLSYDPDKDLDPISLVSTAPVFLLVPGDSPFNSLDELLQEGKKRSLSFGSPGVGTETHLAGEVLKARANVQGEHIPYKGAGPALIDLASGRLDFMFDVLIGSSAFVKDGRVKVLAAADAERSDFLPNIPTFKEGGIEDIDFQLWFATAAPAGTPPDVIERLSRDIGQAMNQPKVKEEFANLGMNIVTTTPAEMQQIINENVQVFSDLLKDTNINIK